jgi:hypothetical protein
VTLGVALGTTIAYRRQHLPPAERAFTAGASRSSSAACSARKLLAAAIVRGVAGVQRTEALAARQRNRLGELRPHPSAASCRLASPRRPSRAVFAGLFFAYMPRISPGVASTTALTSVFAQTYGVVLHAL